MVSSFVLVSYMYITRESFGQSTFNVLDLILENWENRLGKRPTLGSGLGWQTHGQVSDSTMG